MKCLFLFTAVVVAVSVLSASASADLITLFDTNDHDINDSGIFDMPSSVGAGVSSSNLTLGPGLTGQTGWPDTLDATGFFGNAGLSDALTNNDYATVTVTPDSGNKVDYTNFHAVLGANAGDATIHLMSNVTGFSLGNEITAISVSGGPAGAIPLQEFDIDLSLITALQGVEVAVEFRLYYSQIANRFGIGRAFDGTTRDDLRIDGVVSAAVPEPTSFLFVGIGAVLGSLSLRRKK